MDGYDWRTQRARPNRGGRVQIQFADDQPAYRAGACNIGPEEIAQRRRGGMLAIGIAVVVGLVLVTIDAPAVLRLAVFPPLAGGLISLEQVRRRFCVGFALAGLRNFGPLGSPDSVTDVADRAADRRAAFVMTAYMSALALLITLLFVLLPV
jgi:hypothetical protein